MSSVLLAAATATRTAAAPTAAVAPAVPAPTVSTPEPIPPSDPVPAAARTAPGAAAVLAAVVVVPLFFAAVTERVFEPEKAAVLRVLACLALAASAARAWRPGGAAMGRDPLRRALVAAWAAEVVATVLSVAPWPSLMGAYTRGQGALTATAVLALGLAAAGATARPGGPRRVGTIIGIGVLPAGLYAVVQSFGLDPLPWEGDVVTRVVGPAGASVLLGAHLVMALPFAAWQCVESWQAARRGAVAAGGLRLAAWLAATGVGGWALVLTGARGPLVALAAGAGIAVLGAAVRAGRPRWAATVVAMALTFAGAVVALNGAAARGGWPAGAVSRLAVVDRLAHALDPANSTTRVRLRLWEGTVAALRAAPGRLVAGHGPETMDLVWAPHYPSILAYDEPRGWVPDRAHTWVLDTLLTTGGLGLAAGLALVAALVDACLGGLGVAGAGAARRVWLGAAGAGGAAGVAAVRVLDGGWRLAGPAFGLGGVAGLGLGLAWLARRRAAGDRAPGVAWPPEAGFALAALAAVVAHWVEIQVGFEVTTTRLLVAVIAGTLIGARARAAARIAEAARMPEIPGIAEPTSPCGDAGADADRVAAARSMRTDAGPDPAATGPLARAGGGSVTPAEALDVSLRPDAGSPTDADAHRDAAWVAALVGVTMAFDVARPGLAGGGGAVAAALVAIPMLVTLTALWPARPSAGTRAAPAPLMVVASSAVVTAYATGHLVLLAAGTVGPADGGRAVAATTAWFGLALLVLVAARAWGGARPSSAPGRVGSPTARARAGPRIAHVARRPIVGRIAALVATPAATLGVTLAAAAIIWMGPTYGDALAKEGRLAWQADVADLQREGEGGKAESFLRRAVERYATAARLAPWEPAYRLALARAEVEWGDLLDARLSRDLAAARQAESPDEYAPDLLGGSAAHQAAARDARFAAALRAVDAADGLGGRRGPVAALTRARTLRVWADRTRLAELRTGRLAAARAAYAVAAARAPGWPEVLDEAAGVARLAGDPAAALALTRRAIALDRYYVRAWRTAAAAHADLGDPAAAAGAYRRYFEDYRNASDLPALRGWVAALVAAGRDDEALPVARSVVRLAPGDAHAHADLAAVLAATGDRGAALAAAWRAADLDPADPAIDALVRDLAARSERGG